VIVIFSGQKKTSSSLNDIFRTFCDSDGNEDRIETQVAGLFIGTVCKNRMHATGIFPTSLSPEYSITRQYVMPAMQIMRAGDKLNRQSVFLITNTAVNLVNVLS
jgi:hypothetical protein